MSVYRKEKHWISISYSYLLLLIVNQILLLLTFNQILPFTQPREFSACYQAETIAIDYIWGISHFFFASARKLYVRDSIIIIYTILLPLLLLNAATGKKEEAEGAAVLRM